MTLSGNRSAGNGHGVDIRLAVANEAPLISSLYERAYSSSDGRSPSDNYPFPQILDARWVQDAIATRMISWLIAVSEQHAIGAAGLLHGLGSIDDRIGECFGLVVDSQARRRGLGLEMLAALTQLAMHEAEVGIGQMRTADPAAAQVVRRCGFHPVGFEPFVHHMLAGKESMVAVALLSSNALARRSHSGTTTRKVRRLAELVLSSLGAPQLDSLPQTRRARDPSWHEPMQLTEVDDEIGSDLMRRLADTQIHAPGFVDLRRMDELGRQATRRKQRYFCAAVAGQTVGCVHIAHNRHDHHIRIESLACDSDEFQLPTLSELLEVLAQEQRDDPCVMVAEVDVNSPNLQLSLESLGFAPTAYYPALIARGNERFDVVQYTGIRGYAIAEAVPQIDRLQWPAAEETLQAVAHNFEPATSPLPPATPSLPHPADLKPASFPPSGKRQYRRTSFAS
jgi:N-acetylglutamate synthase-like GNAT family acetyltransferase